MCNTNKQICYAPLYVKQQQYQDSGYAKEFQLRVRVAREPKKHSQRKKNKQNYKILCATVKRLLRKFQLLRYSFGH